MRLKQLISAVLFFLAVNVFGSPQRLADSVGDAPLKVKIGPEELGRLVHPLELLKELVNERFEIKKREAISFRQYLEFQQLEILLDATEVLALPGAVSAEQLRLLQTNSVADKNLRNQLVATNSLAVFYARKRDLKNAGGFFEEALELSKQLDDKVALADAAERLAAVRKLSGNYEDAAYYNELAIKMNSALYRWNKVGSGYLELAEVKGLKQQYKEAEFFLLKKAYPLFIRIGNKSGRMHCFESLAHLYRSQNRFSEAKWYYLQAHTMAERLQNLPAKVSSLVHIAQVKAAIGDFELALNDYRSAESLARENNYISKLVEIKGDLGEIYRRRGNYTAAQSALDEYNQLKESLLGEKKAMVF